MLVVPSSFKGTTINTKMRLDHELLSCPETRILKWLPIVFEELFSPTIILIVYLPTWMQVLALAFTPKLDRKFKGNAQDFVLETYAFGLSKVK